MNQESKPVKTYAYLRVSTDSQDNTNQEHGIKNYAESNHISISHTIRDTASGKTDWRHRQLNMIIVDAEPGEILLVSEISRLARSTLQVLEILQAAAAAGLIVHVVKSRLIMDGSLHSRIMATMLGMAAEIEREFIVMRTTEALAKRKAMGLPMGRPAGEAKNLKLDQQTEKLDEWRKMGLGWASIAKLAGCSRSTLYAWAERRRPDWLTKP